MPFEWQDSIEQQQETPDTSSECLNTLQNWLDNDNDDAFFDASVQCLSQVKVDDLKPNEWKTRRILPWETKSWLKFAKWGEKKEVWELEQASNDAQDALDAAKDAFKVAERNKLNPEWKMFFRPSAADMRKPDTPEMIEAREAIQEAKDNLKQAQDKYWNSEKNDKGDDKLSSIPENWKWNWDLMKDKFWNKWEQKEATEKDESNEFANIEPKELFVNNKTLFDKAIITLNSHPDSHEAVAIKSIVEKYVTDAKFELDDNFEMKVKDWNIIISSSFLKNTGWEDLILWFWA